MLPLSLRYRLRQSALYLLLMVGITLVVVRAVVLLVPVAQAANRAADHAGELAAKANEWAVHATVDSDELVDREAEGARRQVTAAVQQSRQQARLLGEALLPVLAGLIVLSFGLSAYSDAPEAGVALVNVGGFVLVGFSAYVEWDVLSKVWLVGWDAVAQLLTSTQYLGAKMLVAVGVLVAALGYDLTRRRRAGAQQPVDGQLRLVARVDAPEVVAPLPLRRRAQD